MRGIGLDRWPGFLSDAAERAEADQPADGRIVLAQATTNAVNDASMPPGHYVSDNPEQWIGQPSVGTGECVPLVQQATGAPRSSEWRPGVSVQGNTAIRPGTAIATFDSNGHYSGHAAIYIGQDENGIRVVDQWNIRDREGRIIGRHTPSARRLWRDEPGHDRIDRGESYHVVE
jgi:hypothetical protein